MSKTTKRTTKKLLGDFLKQKRKSVGLSQRDVSDKLGYSTPQFISNWERGVSYPPIKELRTVANLYKISSEELFTKVLEITLQEVAEDLKRKFAAASK